MLTVPAFGASGPETYFRFPTPDRTHLDKLARLISLDDVQDGFVYAYANADELRRFKELGYSYETLPHPGTLIIPKMSRSTAALAAWDSYPTYDAYVSMMYQFQSDHPALCQVVQVGSSVLGRAILFARISDNIGSEENEPEVMYTSSMHGDETTGYILCLRFIDSLLTAYGSDAYITRLVDSLEIWINPLANPDGTYHSGDHTVYGATRYNANFVDINRNFPDPADGDHPDGYSWQPETMAMIDLAGAQRFIISANQHGGAEVVNYPWDTWARAHSDQEWYQDICHQWADTAQAYSPSGYMDGFDDGITNGYAWYRVAGGRQDFMNYWHGCREITVELSNTKLLAASLLPAHWEYNRLAMLQYLENALYGIRGIVTEAVSGLPLAATVRVLVHDFDQSEVSSDPEVGDYHRMIAAGVYNVQFSALGFYPDTAFGVTVVDRQATIADAALQPLPGVPDLAFADHDAALVNPGSNVSLHVTLRNDGAANGIGVAAVLATTDPFVTVTQISSSFPIINLLGGIASSVDAYTLSVAPECPLNHAVELTLDISASGGYQQTETFWLTVGPLVERFETADFARFPWTSDGLTPWEISPGEAGEGTYSAISGLITHEQSSQLTLTVAVPYPGKLSFLYKASSEQGFDWLTFSVDDQPLGSWSGYVGWSEASFMIEAGQHSLMWTYSKDVDGTMGDDRAWVDRIILPALVSGVQIETAALPDWTVGQPYQQPLVCSGWLGTTTWTDRDGDLAGSGLAISSDGTVSGVPSSAGGYQFTARVTDEAGGSDEGLLTLTINQRPIILTASLPDASRGEQYERQLAAQLGTPPLTWSDIHGDLASIGLTLSSDGLVSGTPSAPSLLEFTVMVQDAAGAADSAALQIYISGGCCEGTVGDANNDGGAEPTIGDISTLIDFLFLSQAPLVCYAEGDVNQSGGVDPIADDITIADISLLIDHLFINRNPPAECL